MIQTERDEVIARSFTAGWSAAINEVVDAQARGVLDGFLIGQRNFFKKASD